MDMKSNAYINSESPLFEKGGQGGFSFSFNLFWVISAFIILVVLFFICRHESYQRRIYVLSVSSDGHYAISTDFGGRAVLWDLIKHKRKIIDRHANSYSAYFIKNTDDFMWQNQDEWVHVQDVNGKKIQTFKVPFTVFGQVMTSDLQHYLASDIDWNVFLKDNQELRKIRSDQGGFLGGQKLYNLTLSADDKTVLGSGLGSSGNDNLPNLKPNQPGYYKDLLIQGVALWDVNTGKALQKYSGNVAKTFATISPDEQYVVGGDEDSWGYVWETNTGKAIFQLWSLSAGIATKQDQYGDNIEFNKAGLISVPKDFMDDNDIYHEDIISLKFIDQTHYLRFTTRTPYAILYNLTDPKPQKYFPLGRHPWPAVNQYYRDQAIDTSWQAHILVMGKEYKGGILVYQYDPEKKTLTKVWDEN